MQRDLKWAWGSCPWVHASPHRGPRMGTVHHCEPPDAAVMHRAPPWFWQLGWVLTLRGIKTNSISWYLGTAFTVGLKSYRLYLWESLKLFKNTWWVVITDFFFNTYWSILVWKEIFHLTKFNLDFFLKQNSVKGFTSVIGFSIPGSDS